MAFSSGIVPGSPTGLELNIAPLTKGGAKPRTVNGITTINAKGTFSSTGGEKGPDVQYYLCNNTVYGQTLFLGCTVKSYNCSLGWGAEAGRLEVELVHDDCVYPELRDYNGNFVTKPIFSDAEDHYVNNRANNGFQRDIDGNPLVPGKVFYRPDKNKGKIVSDYWYYADPGFFGERQYGKDGKILNEAIDLMGVPVYFRHDNFAFNGIIQSWENTGGEGGTKTYKVIIESPANLLNNVSLILDQYHGTIFRVKSGNEKGFPGYVQNEANERYGGTIYEQNIPNVINVYGFWEQFAFGNSGRNEEGMPAVNIINAVHYLLSSKLNPNKPDNRIYKFSPFGRIIGRTPKYSTGDGSAPANDSIGTDFRIRYGLGISTNGSNDGSITSIFNVPFIGMGLVTGIYDRFGIARMAYNINLFEILDPYLLKYYRVSNGNMTISELVGNICASTGKEYFVNLNLNVDDDTRSPTYGEIIPTIYISTISKLYPTADNAVESFITWISSLGTIVNSYSKGKSYNATEPVRTMLIGGKQQRLYQVKNPKYSVKQTITYYNPYINKFSTIDHSNFNFYKEPNTNSTRNPLLYTTQGNSNIGLQGYEGRIDLSEDANFYVYDNKWQIDPNTVPPILGNFYQSYVIPGIGEAAKNAGQTPIEPLNGYYNENNMPYPASDNDAICPYFGQDRSTGGARRVFSGSNGFIIEFSFDDFGMATGYSFDSSGYLYIHENELRAAMVNIDSFAGYLAMVYYDHQFYGLPQIPLFNQILIPYFGLGKFRWIMDGLINSRNLASTSNGIPVVAPGLSANYTVDPELWDMLTKIQTFLGNIGNTYYGKQFMISIPSPQAWKDSGPFFDSNGNPIQISIDSLGNPVYLKYGSQKWNFSFEPTDFAWEEPMSVIDEGLVVGTNSMINFTQDNGSIEAFLAYDYTYQYNYSKAFGTVLYDNMRTQPTTDLFNSWKHDAYIRSVYGQRNDNRSPSTPIGTDIYDFLQPSLDLNEGADNFATDLGYASKTETSDGFIDIPARKVYTKATVEKTPIVYYKRNGVRTSKIIVSSNGLNLSAASADALRVNVAATDYMAKAHSTNPTMAVISSKVLSMNSLFGGADAQDTGNDQYNNIQIAKKAAIPSFAAIPILFNNAVYGPWISAPDRLMSKIFPNDNFQTRLLKLENLVGGTKVEINDGLVPWNYGGMRVLDEAAVQLIGQDNNYQSTTEQGNIVTYGLPLLNMGDELKAAGATFNGPIVNNVQVQISESGPLTTYSFRTYTRKLTLFNKENADRLQKNANNTIKLQREINQKIRTLTNKIAAGTAGTIATSKFYEKSKLQQYSPIGVLVGYSTPFISHKSALSQLTSKYPNKYTPGSWTKDSLQSFTQVTVQDIRELAQEFDNNYSSKSIMSLDGIFAPISFYPTKATIPIKKYNTSYCPACNGSRQYTYKGITYFCEYCQPIDTSSTKTKVYSSVPPFILSNQADDTILNNPNAIDDLLKTLQKKKINYINLNPIIMPVGELRNAYAQDSDYNAHNIDIVGKGLIPPESISYKHNLSINQTYIDPITGEETPGLEIYDQNHPFSDLDAKSKDFDNRQKIRTTNHQLNCRFLGLKGPLTMAGWGFDIEGFPVPNSSGEPQSVDKLGRPLKIRDKRDAVGSFDPSYPGTILGKNQKFVSGQWTEPYKEDTFYKSWGLRSDLWPAGPVDLRWDESRGVWSASNDTKRFVNVQLEDNLLSPFPARGFLNAIDKTTPLPSGLRRMVFVKDSEGSYCAPRGAKLLCYYDDNTGFYEPISKNYIMTSGKILDNGTAKIFDTYARGFDQITGMPEKPNEIEVTFHNMMNFSIVRDKQIGIFAFMQNQWKLISTNSCDNVNI